MDCSEIEADFIVLMREFRSYPTFYLKLILTLEGECLDLNTFLIHWKAAYADVHSAEHLRIDPPCEALIALNQRAEKIINRARLFEETANSEVLEQLKKI